MDSDDLWIYIYQKGEARFSDLIKDFVDSGKRSRVTIINYKIELEKTNKIKKKISLKTKRPVYYVPPERLDEVQALMEKRQITKEIEDLPKNKREEFLLQLTRKNNLKILNALALEGPINIQGIAEKTGITETKILETIWGPLVSLGLVTADKKYWLPDKEREYSLTLIGFYRALRENIDNFGVIAKNWGHLHQFIFDRVKKLESFDLDESLRTFLTKVKIKYYTESEEETRNRIEKYLIAFIISGYNARYIMDWMKFIHQDKEFRELFEKYFIEKIDGYKLNIATFETAQKVIKKLSRRSEPKWNEFHWEISRLHGLEGFLSFPQEY